MATISSARETDYDNLIVFFQPHTYSRINLWIIWHLHLKALINVTWWIFTLLERRNVYGISSADLAKNISKLVASCQYIWARNVLISLEGI